MKATQERTRPRKNTSLNTACCDCYRTHRGCDGLRPCKRRVDLRRGPSCRDLAPNERIPWPKKRKRSKPKDRGNNSLTAKKQKRDFCIVDTQSFLAPNRVVINNKSCITPPSSFPTAVTHRSPTFFPRDWTTNQTQASQHVIHPVALFPLPVVTSNDSEQSVSDLLFRNALVE